LLTHRDRFTSVLRKCRKLRDELRSEAADNEEERQSGVSKPLPDGVSSEDIVEVADLPTEHVLEGVEAIAVQIANQVMARKGLSLEIPSRAATNQIYIPEWDRIVLGGKRSARRFLHVKESRKTAITIRVLHLIHSVLRKRIHITKRDLFYTDVKLFVDQAESDGVLDDVATMIGCTRSK
jgi:meiotic recombination protein SPO11